MMAAAREILSTTLTGTTNLQSETRQGNRKRKQNMPSASAHTNDTASSSSDAVSQQPPNNMSQVKVDKRLLATIQAVASFNFPEELVLSCALDMQKSGRTVNSNTLLDECELRFQDESSLQSYAKEVDNTRCTAVSEPIGATAALPLEPSHSALTSLSFQIPTHDCPESLSLQSANISCSSRSGKYDRPKDIPTKGNEQSRYTGANDSKHTPSDSSQHSSVLSREPSDFGEDVVDGHLLSPVVGVSDSSFNMWAQSSGGSLNDLNKSLTTLPSSLPVATGNMVSNLARQDPELLLSRQLSGPSHFDQKNVSDLSHAQNGSTVFKDVAAADSKNNIALNVELETKRTNGGGETLSVVRESNQNKAEFRKLCFNLVEKEHALLEKSRLCSLCLSRPRDVTFLPCGHFTSCRTCAEPTYVCPCCNKNILATVDTYLS